MRNVLVPAAVAWVSCLSLAACGGGGSGGSGGSGTSGTSGGTGGSGGGTTPPPTYTIGGSVSGLLSSASVVLLDNGSDALTVGSNGAFTFKTALASGATYAVSVGTQPRGETCTVSSGSGTGTVGTGDLKSVVVNCVASTPTFVSIVSLSDTGANANEGAQNPSISSTGRFVTFASVSTNLVSTPVQRWQVYLRDTCLGATSCTPSTQLISVDAAGSAGGSDDSGTVMASVSGDGQQVVFTSQATDIISGATVAETYERSTCLAPLTCSPSSAYAIVQVDGQPATYGGYGTVIDASGRYILSAANSADIVISEFNPSGPYNAGIVDLYERDTCTTTSGPVPNCTPGNVALDFTPLPSQPDRSVDFEYGFAVSNGGRFAAFGSGATDLVPQNNNGVSQIYLTDTCNIANNPVAGCKFQTILISMDASGNAGSQTSWGPSISDDGRFVAFTSSAKLAPLAGSAAANAYLRDTCLAYTSRPIAGCTPTTHLVSINAAGTADAGGSTAFSQSLSADGRFVAFEGSGATITASGQGGGVYVRDTCNSSAGAVAGCTPRTVLVSIDGAGNLIAASSYHALSADGHFLAFSAGSGTLQVPAGQVVLVATGF